MAIKKIESINVIPFIDIMLVLLAIVLTTATFIAKGSIRVDLPRASAKPAVLDKPREIAITAEGTLYLDGTETAVAALIGALGRTPRERTIVVSGDARMDYRHFIAVIDTLTAGGYTHVAMTTRRE